MKLEVKFVFLFFGFLFLLGFVSAGIFDKTCGDGTLDGECSEYESYFCLDGELIENPSECGCPDNFEVVEGECFSEFKTNPKEISLDYTLRGKKGEIDLKVYGGVKNYLFELPDTISYSSGEQPDRIDFKLRGVDEPIQKDFLIPLLVKIQNEDKDKLDQARIAISLVQNFDFGYSGEVVSFNSHEINYSRYPYETLYDQQGVCGEKSELLVFLLREIGYETVFFYNKLENHESVGIKCPEEYGHVGTGYCFVETTGPAIMTNNENEYLGGIKLTSKPEVIKISEGDSLEDDLEEYRDAKTEIKINNVIREKNRLNFFRYLQARRLNKYYGLNE